MKRILFFGILSLLSFFYSFSQVNPGSPNDTLKVVEILHANRYGYQKKDSLTELLLLVGKVALKQDKTLFYADSAVFNKNEKIVEAFGNVHINDNDSTNTYSQYLLYHVDTKIAILKKNVRLTDSKSDLYTDELEYDMNTKIGVYRNGGRVINGSTVLTSKEGTYYADLKDAYFKKDVKLKDPKYSLASDSLLYNSNSQIATFIAPTTIEDSAGRTIVTSEGYYDLKNRNAFFGKRPVIRDGAVTIIANEVETDDKTGMNTLVGNALFRDTAQGIAVLANHILSNRNEGFFLATQHPLMILKQENDSIYITADTLFSGRLSNLKAPVDSMSLKDTTSGSDSAAIDSMSSKVSISSKDSMSSKDTIRGTVIINSKTNDSTDRYFQAYRHVRIFSDSLQAVSDSLFYSGKDSVFQLFQQPVVWASGNQVTGDTIYLFTKNKKAERLFVFENGLLINKAGEHMFNQIKGNRLTGYFNEGAIDYMRAKGNAESVYYVKDDEQSLIGVNKASADIIDMRFHEKELNRVIFISEVKGTMYPLRKISEEDRTLRNFQWHDDIRPKTKFELFGN